jgi:mRNA-degrading endonuclease RelE of RelBE toxin-antitoxin system
MLESQPIYSSPAFVRQLVNLPTVESQRLVEAIVALPAEPRHANGRAQKVGGDLYRLEVDDYRIFYTVVGNDVGITTLANHRAQIAPEDLPQLAPAEGEYSARAEVELLDANIADTIKLAAFDRWYPELRPSLAECLQSEPAFLPLPGDLWARSIAAPTELDSILTTANYFTNMETIDRLKRAIANIALKLPPAKEDGIIDVDYVEHAPLQREMVVRSKSRPPVGWMLLGAGGVIALFGLWKGWGYFSSPKVAGNRLAIGVLEDPSKYAGLQEYLQGKFAHDDFWRHAAGKGIQTPVEGDRQLSYQEAKNRLAKRQWDIAFTFSPILSTIARDNGYQYVGRMFPNRPPYYKSVIFTRANSPIRTIADIRSNMTIALGEFNSASSFIVPSYMLYGKTLRVDRPYRGSEIIDRVRQGNVDLGAASIDDVKRAGAGFRIVAESNPIPGASVYISPRLTPSERQAIVAALLDAPAAVKKEAEYDRSAEPNYAAFLPVRQRSEEVLACADFTKNPVDFYCKNPPLTPQLPTSLRGTIVAVNPIGDDRLFLSLSVPSEPNIRYSVIVSRAILNQVPNAPAPTALKGTKIKLYLAIVKVLPDNNRQIEVTTPGSISVD